MATLALRAVENAARYGRVVEEQGKVVAFLEKDASREGPGIINGGIYVLKREILDCVHDLPCSLEQDVFPTLAERGEIQGHEFNGYFLDIGLPETLEQGRRELPRVRLRPAAVFDRSALVRSAGGDPEAFQWTEGSVEAIRALNDRGYYVFVIGHRPEGAEKRQRQGEARRLNAAIQERLAADGAHVDRFYDEPEFAPGQAIDDAKGKPFSSLLFEAMSECPIVRQQSLFIGARRDDAEASRRAGIEPHVFDRGDLSRLVHSLLT